MSNPTCPCCGEIRNAGEIEIYINLAIATMGGDTDWHTRYAHSRRLSWACDACITSGRAIVGNPSLQKFGLGPPRYAYIDDERECRDCGNYFVFSAKEQQYWYEVLQLQGTAVHCLPCRKMRQAHNAIQNELTRAIENLPHGLNTKDPDELAYISEVYLKAGRTTKALEFYRRAKNRIKTSGNPEVLSKKLEELRTQLDAMQAAEK
jgi:hypothetical protein